MHVLTCRLYTKYYSVRLYFHQKYSNLITSYLVLYMRIASVLIFFALLQTTHVDVLMSSINIFVNKHVDIRIIYIDTREMISCARHKYLLTKIFKVFILKCHDVLGRYGVWYYLRAGQYTIEELIYFKLLLNLKNSTIA